MPFQLLVFLLVCLCCPALAYSAEKAKISRPSSMPSHSLSPLPPAVIELHDLDGDLGLEPEPGTKIKKGIEPAYSQGQQPLPPLEQLESFFEEVGLASELKSWDQLDRDILYQRAGSYSLADLSVKYPSLSASKLLRLQHLAQGKTAR